MKRIGLLVREKTIDDIKERTKDITGCFFVSFNKVKAFPYNTLRNELRGMGSKVFVAKNSMFKRAFQELGYQDCDALLEGETGVVFVYDKDVVKTCKVLMDFSKEKEVLEVRGGLLGDQKLTSAQVSALAKLPSKEVLLGAAVSSLASPLTGFLGVLNQMILKFVWVVEEIKKTKEQK
jgi:large subunit ribosomal protein L10